MQHSFAKIIRRQRGFTMTELLVVIAITGILLGLLFVPIIQGFNLTRKAQNQIQAQTQARNGINAVAREIAQAVLVLDNTSAPINFPLSFAVNINQNSAATLPATWANGRVVYPARVLFTKIDFVPSGRLSAGGTKDPTTGDTIGGSPVRFPLAPGTRLVRYFIGLKDNTKPYQNVFQRPTHSAATADVVGTVGGTEYPFASDPSFNPFVLYRAEYDPNDPKLFNLANYTSAREDQGGFNDPNFFYNYNAASNGQPYAANWKAIASAVVDGPNQDVVTWVKDEAGDLQLASPFRPLVSFAPGSVVGDTATPGFLTAAAAEVPNAVPTVYNAQQGHWSLPATLSIYRAVSSSDAGSPNFPNFGALKISVDNEIQTSGPLAGTVRPHVHIETPGASENRGSLEVANADQLFCARIASTNEIFVKTPNLTFLINMERGTVQTGFPPLAGDPTTRAPYLRLANGSIVPMQPAGTFDDAYPDINTGELVPTLYRINTRDPRAAITVDIPTNQGWGELDLWDNINPASGIRYFLADSLNPSSAAFLAAPIAVTQVGAYASPMLIFGNVAGVSTLNPGGGLMVAAGSERVMGPDLLVSTGNSMDQVAGASANAALRSRYVGPVAYNRSPGAVTSVVKKSTQVPDQVNSNYKRWTAISGQRTYSFDQDTRLSATGLPTAFLRFDNPGGPGLPAWPMSEPAADAGVRMDRELQVTYLWQNNYARLLNDNPATGGKRGQPVDAQGKVIGEKAIIAPEPDVMKIDYATRDLLTVNVGVLVYDTNTRQSTAINLTDKVRVNNTIR